MSGYNDWSAAAQRAYDDAEARRILWDFRLERMAEGPFYDHDTQTLRIPSYCWFEAITPKANAEWKRRGLLFDKPRREWFCKVPTASATDQVAKAHKVFFGIWQCLTPKAEAAA